MLFLFCRGSSEARFHRHVDPRDVAHTRGDRDRSRRCPAAYQPQKSRHWLEYLPSRRTQAPAWRRRQRAIRMPLGEAASTLPTSPTTMRASGRTSSTEDGCLTVGLTTRPAVADGRIDSAWCRSRRQIDDLASQAASLTSCSCFSSPPRGMPANKKSECLRQE